MKRKLLLTLLALTTALSTTACSTETDSTRKENGVFFNTNDGQIIITGDSQIWNVDGLELKNGNKVRVSFDTLSTTEKEDDIITNVKHQIIPWNSSVMYNLAERANDGKHFIVDIYQVQEIIFPTDSDPGEPTIKYIFDDAADFVARYY